MDSTKTVLLIQDNEDNRLIYSTMLRHCGYAVLEAGDGIIGVQLARDAHPDIILMDVSIPGIDGHEATRMLKADAATGSIPIVVLTAHALRGDRELALAAGADSYISKPAEPRSIVAEVIRLIGAPTSLAEACP